MAGALQFPFSPFLGNNVSLARSLDKADSEIRIGPAGARGGEA